MRISIAAGTCAIALLLAGPAFGHHSAAGIDRTKTVEITGTVKEFRWANPHSWISMEVTNDKGGVDIWNLELQQAPGTLVRNGWRASTLKPGDKVSIVARPLRNGDPGGQFVSVKLPSGQILTERGPQ